jgi:hypothetical protein
MGVPRTTTILPPPPADVAVLSACWQVAYESIPLEARGDYEDQGASPTGWLPGSPTEIDDLAAEDIHYRTEVSALWE